ncbi:hypothetical protein ACFVYT_42265 [Streptomyces sp. NPDC058290]|uniref:hypothetical protein n=1 Tax=Streptomyces sp. NPDC058290 TaxID=3346426 RepID=UPI0036E8214B
MGAIPHPDAAPLLVKTYAQAGCLGYAMSLLSRIHRDDPRSLAIGLLRLIIHARYTGADAHTVELGIDLLARADHRGLFAGLVKEHRSWHGPPPHDDVLAGIYRDAVSAVDARNHPAAKAFSERLLAWSPEFARVWFILGTCFEFESGQHPSIEPTEHLVLQQYFVA